MTDRATDAAHDVADGARALPQEVANELDEISKAVAKHVDTVKGQARKAFVVTKQRIGEEARGNGPTVRQLRSKAGEVRNRAVRAGRRVASTVRATAERPGRRGPGGGSGTAT